MPMPSSHMLCSLLAASLLMWGVGCKSKPEVKNINDGPSLIKQAKNQGAELEVQRYEASIEAARLAIEGKQYKDAARAYEEAIKMQPENWELYMDLGIVRSKEPDFLGAVEAISQAMERGGREDWRTWYNLGNVYQNRGLYKESTDAYRVAIGLQDEPHVPTLLNLGSGYIFLRRYDEAEQTLEYTRGVAPGEVRVVHNMALILHMKRDFQKALAKYDEAVQMDPNFAQSHYNRGDVLIELKRYDEAISAYGQYSTLEPTGPYIKRALRKIEWSKQQLNR